MKIKILSLYNMIVDVFVIVGKQVQRSILSHYNIYMDMLVVLLFTATLFDIDPLFQARFLSFVFQLLILIGFKSLVRLIRAQKKAQAYEFPLLPKRLTIKESDSFVYVKKSDYQKMVLYMAELEDYFERSGIAEWN